MLPVWAWAALRSYAPIVMLPISFTVGFVGYNLEWWLRESKVSDVESVGEARKKRQEEELYQAEFQLDKIDSIYKDKPKKTIFTD